MLLPEVKGSGLIGIARLADESSVIEAKRQVEYRELQTRKWICKPQGRPMPFDWGINPYRGCEFGCKYCYARYTHEFMELHDTLQFEREIYVKKFDRSAFARELARIPLRDSIAIGTATDPYQPAERRYENTRRILEVFAECKNRTVSVTTKSDLVARDAELLQAIARNNSVLILMTITTADEHLARLVEPFAPRPELRLKAIRKLTDHGVRTMVLASPVMPLITDSRLNLETLAKQVKEAGAIYMSGGVLFLKPCAQKAYFPFLEKYFPHLVPKYLDNYRKSAFLSGAYPKLIATRIAAARERFGLVDQPERYLPRKVEEEASQLALFNA